MFKWRLNGLPLFSFNGQRYSPYLCWSTLIFSKKNMKNLVNGNMQLRETPTFADCVTRIHCPPQLGYCGPLESSLSRDTDLEILLKKVTCYVSCQTRSNVIDLSVIPTAINAVSYTTIVIPLIQTNSHLIIILASWNLFR